MPDIAALYRKYDDNDSNDAARAFNELVNNVNAPSPPEGGRYAN